MMQSETAKILNANLILTRLQERVSKTNAKLLLDMAKIQCGFQGGDDNLELERENAKTLCLSMIKQGGPSFQVGQSIYKEYLM
jgi:hypothetical protein